MMNSTLSAISSGEIEPEDLSGSLIISWVWSPRTYRRRFEVNTGKCITDVQTAGLASGAPLDGRHDRSSMMLALAIADGGA